MLTHAVRFDPTGAPHPLDTEPLPDVAAEVREARKEGGFLWLELWMPDEAEMASVADPLALDPRATRDAVTGRQQPKIQQFGDHLAVVLWTLELTRTYPTVTVGEVFLFIAPGVLVTVRRMRVQGEEVQSSHLADPDAHVEGGALGAAFAVMAQAAAGYSHLADTIEDELEELEREVFDDSVRESRARIYRLRGQIGKVDRAVATFNAALSASERHFEELSVDNEDIGPWVRDLMDDLAGTAVLANDQNLTLDAVVASHENNVAAQQNEDTSEISAIAAMLSIPAVTSGLFGMNFKDLPLVNTTGAWAWVMGAVVLIDLAVYVAFKRRHWL